jgi:hypothetical protein
MTPKQKYLFHQSHPLKLSPIGVPDVSRSYPLWRHDLTVALVIVLVPPPVASWLVIGFADLKPHRRSAFGRYVARHDARDGRGAASGG